jgi:predicted small secreted protein
MRDRVKLFVALALLLAAAPMLSACYTTKGAGEDLSAAGHGITHAADEHTGYKP